LSAVRKVVLSVSAAIGIPLMLGLSASPLAPQQAQAEPVASPNLNAQRRSEQALPRTPVAFEPAHFDKYVGYYQLGPATIFTVSRDGGHYFARLTGQVNVEFFPESETKFFATIVPVQISFDTDAQGRVTGLVLHQNGLEQPALRVSESERQTSKPRWPSASGTIRPAPAPRPRSATRSMLNSRTGRTIACWPRPWRLPPGSDGQSRSR
jgi:hypothetical protein